MGARFSFNSNNRDSFEYLFPGRRSLKPTKEPDILKPTKDPGGMTIWQLQIVIPRQRPLN